MKAEYPILEFDPSRETIIEPSLETEGKIGPEHFVLCFHREVVETVSLRHSASILHEFDWEDGVHRVLLMEFDGQPIAYLQPGIGAPLSAAMLDACIALGGRKFIACGGAGVLDSTIPVSHVIVPTAAVRDEGTSYHYVPPSRQIAPSPEAVDTLVNVLESHDIPYLTGLTWTTDGPYRETRDKVQLRRSEGCITVEMEAAALFAVAQYRRVTFGQLLYGGDDVGGEKWDTREWRSQAGIREKLFWLAVEACLKL